MNATTNDFRIGMLPGGHSLYSELMLGESALHPAMTEAFSKTILAYCISRRTLPVFVLRFLADMPRESSSRLLHLNLHQVDEAASLAAQVLPRMMEKEKVA